MDGGAYLSFHEEPADIEAALKKCMEVKKESEKDKDGPTELSDIATDLLLRDEWQYWEQLVKAPNTGHHKQENYKDLLKPIVVLKTVKDFLCLLKKLPQPSAYFQGLKPARMGRDGAGGPARNVDAIMLFRKGVRPEWEDPANAKGGHFECQLKYEKPCKRVDENWNNVLMGILSGEADPDGCVTGIRLADKLQAHAACLRLELWFNSSTSPEQKGTLEKSLKDCMMSRLDGSAGKGNIDFDPKLHESAKEEPARGGKHRMQKKH